MLFKLVNELIKYCFVGNLCRCTGYRPILEGLMSLTTCDQSVKSGCSMGSKCCKKTKEFKNEDDNMTISSDFLPYDPTQEPIFPPELIVRNKTLPAKPVQKIPR